MSKPKRFFETRDFYKLQGEWYKKLKDAGFYDIEGGCEGHLLKGPNSTISLSSLAHKRTIEQGLGKGIVQREFDDVADALNDDLAFFTGGKARYFHHALELATQAYQEGILTDDICATWALHAQGEGERVIADLVEIPRSRVRVYLATLRENIKIRIDNEGR
jgi:hypothetical protein